MQSLSKQENREIPDIYKAVEDSKVTVIGFDLPTAVAVSVMDKSGRCFIGLDSSRRFSKIEEKALLMHELGHCQTGSFYCDGASELVRAKCEKKADAWAIEHFLPYDKIIEAYKSGITNNYELAEYFEVSEQYVSKAIEYYRQRY